MRIFVAGATGVVGVRLVPLLVAAGHEVTAATRSPQRAAVAEAGGARAIPVDLFDVPALQRAVPGHDAVVNLATHIPPMDWRMFLPGAWRENDRVRRVASANLARAALHAGARRFIQESFAPVYPDRGDQWITEEVPIAPVRYNLSVADAELSAARFSEAGGAGVVLRFGGFYGSDAAQTRAMADAVRKGWAPLPGRPDAFISSISHDDAASATLAALQAPAGIYNVVDDVPLRRREFFDALARILDVPAPRMLPAWTRHLMGSLGSLMARSERISNRKLRQSSGWTPRYPSAREGLRAALGQSE